MEIYQLRAFLAVARHGHLTRAATQLHLTQPAVSKQIKALEGELGVFLFERQPTGMSLTSEGIELLSHAERTLTAAMDLLQVARQLRTEVIGDLLLGTIIDPETLRLGDVLKTLLLIAPGLQPRLKHGISGSILARVSAGELDAGFMLGPVDDPELEATELRCLTYRIVGPSAWRDRLASAGLKELCCMPWVGTPSGSSQHRLVRDLFEAEGLHFKTVVEADQESSMADLASSGVGLATMREDLAWQAEARGSLTIWRGRKLSCVLSFVHRRARRDEPFLRAAVQAVSRVWSTSHSEEASTHENSPLAALTLTE